jgi:hypothetical protein
MPARSPAHSDQRQINVLDVRLLDLFAQVEAIMRCARDVQRHAIRLREKVAVNAPDADAKARIRKTVARLSRESQALQSVVQLVGQAADDLGSRAALPRSRPRGRAARASASG